MIIQTDNKSVTRFFQTKIIPPTLWNACDHVMQFNFTIAHIPGKNNTAADYLSRLEFSPKEKLILRIREDISITPIEFNVQSAGVTEEEQIFTQMTTKKPKNKFEAETGRQVKTFKSTS